MKVVPSSMGRAIPGHVVDIVDDQVLDISLSLSLSLSLS
jgi:hypothetical protein